MQGWRPASTGSSPSVTVNYDPVGSGGGREQFLAGGVDFAGSDSALTDDELAKAADPLRRPAASSSCRTTSRRSPSSTTCPASTSCTCRPATIAKIFTGSITTWNDPAIAADNPDAKLPSTAITPVHRSDKSGTTKNFTDYLSKAAAGIWTERRGRRPGRSRAARPAQRHLRCHQRREGRRGRDRLRRREPGRRPRRRQDQGRQHLRRAVGRGRRGQGRRELDRSVRAAASTTSPTTSTGPRRGRRVPDRAGQLPHRLREVRRTRPRPTW